jgi:hypothetical protein
LSAASAALELREPGPAVIDPSDDVASAVASALARAAAAAAQAKADALAEAARQAAADKASALARAAEQAAAEQAAAVAEAVANRSAAPQELKVVKVKLAQSALRLKRGQHQVVAAGVYFAEMHPSYREMMVWKSSNPKVAKVSQNGKVTAVKAGTATITVTPKTADAEGTTVSASLKVKVVAKAPKSRVTKVSASVPKTMKPGQISYVTGKYSPQEAVNVKISYSTGDSSAISVDEAGRLVANEKGTGILTVKAGAKTKKYKVTVR